MESNKETIPAAKTPKKSLGEMLIENKLVTAEQLDNALKLQQQQGGKLGEILVKQGLIKAEELAAVLSVGLNLPLIDLKRHMVQPNAIQLIPEDMARKHTLIPLDVVGDSLVVVMADPEDIGTIEDIKAQAKMNIEVALGVPSDVERAIDWVGRWGNTITTISATETVGKEVSQSDQGRRRAL